MTTRAKENDISNAPTTVWKTLKDGWALLERPERRSALAGLVLFCTAAFMSSLMVGSIFPFLAVLSDPSTIEELPFVTAFGAFLGLETTYQYLFGLGAISAIVIVLTSGLLILRTFFIERFCAFMVYRLSRRLLKHYLSQPYPFFIDHHSGDLASSVLSEASSASGAFLKPTANLMSSSLTVLAILAILIALNPIVAGVGLLVIASFYGIVIVSCRHFALRLGQVRLDANQSRYRVASEVIGGIKDVKLTGKEDAYLSRFDYPSRTIAESVSKISVLTETPRYIMQTIAFVGIILICLVMMRPDTVGTAAGIGGILPALGILALAAQRLSPEIQTMYAAGMQLRFGAATLERILGIFDTPGEAFATDGIRPAPLALAQELTLKGISYAYPNAELSGISGVTCSIKAGERIGIVGSTGAGKTTFADVVLGLLPPQSGEMAVDGQLVDRSNVRSWQQSISYVPQEIFLTDASIRENIALGVETSAIDEARVEQCAQIAKIHEFISNELPLGYATPTGERGVRLSGGQRQRIGLARALYREADLLVLDEATSALDNVTEREVLDGIGALSEQKTIIMIAHRLSTLRACSRLFLMERGRIVAAGPWDILLATSPAFRELVEHADSGVSKVAE
ncbi:MAG: ABC transporter ATP-binding protein [Pseudomonadota bacterium]